MVTLERRFDPARPEMIDLPDPDPALLRGEMENLRRINRRFGGLSAIRGAVAGLAARVDPGRPLELLDLAAGSADIPISLSRRLARLGRRVRITAVDRNEAVLAEARRHAAGAAEIAFVRADILRLDFPPRSFDIVLCSLALHHFTRDDAVRIVREMVRLSRTGFVISDLRRSRTAVACAWLYTRFTTMNVMTRTDAIASVRASFTLPELEGILAEAGAGGASIRRIGWFRLLAAGLSA